MDLYGAMILFLILLPEKAMDEIRKLLEEER